MLGLLPAAPARRAAVDWLRYHLAPAIAVPAIAAVGLARDPRLRLVRQRRYRTMPTALPAVDRPIAADHSSSIVVDVPYGSGRHRLHGTDSIRNAQVLRPPMATRVRSASSPGCPNRR